MFRPVASRPDFVAQEHDLLREWAARRTFARLRAQNAGGPRFSFLDGPITANNPMGVHHAWGRTYKDLYQRFHAMLGEDQRYQNGFDCQGLWVEVDVERDLGFTSKRDIEAFGIAEFVSLCKQRVLTFAARQTEQSVRLGTWMDWNDPAELLRLRDLLAEDPAQPATIAGPDGPVTDTVEMVVGRLGMPDVGGSYFTFSNENNDLIWGFLAECHRRGWIYRGHDTMPWCPRCGTGLSQMEMNEGYQDREDPGLTVRLPLVDRPGETLLVWTTTPWTLAANVAAAVGPDLRYVRVRQGEDQFWLSRGTLKQVLQGPFQVLEERPGADLVGWRYAGPFDDLPAVRDAFGAAGYEHRVVAVGRGRRGGGDRDRPHRARLRRRGLPARHGARPAGRRPDRRGRPVLRGVRLAHRPRGARDHRGDRRRRSSSAASSTTSSRTATATRTAGDAARRCCSGSSTSGTSAWARSMTSRATADAGPGRREPPLPDHGGRRPDPVDPVVRLRARARLAPQHARLDDLQEALLRPGAADLRLPGVRDVRGHRRARGARASAPSRAGRRSRATRPTGRSWTR